MKWFVLALLPLSACASEASVAPPPASVVEAEPPPPSPAAAAEDVTAYAARVAALEPLVRPAVEEAVGSLQVDCPYNRASFQLPVALALAAGSVEGRGLEPEARATWRAVRSGLVAHAAAVDALAGPDWRMPAPGENLHGLDAIVSRAELEAAEDPIATTTALLVQITATVDDYDDATTARIEAASDTLRPFEASPWRLKLALLGWKAGLEAVAPQLTDATERARLEAMIAAIDLFASTRC